jgi:dihydropteroate synthase
MRPEFRIPLPDGDALELGARTLIMGVINVTPDSFSDGGRFLDPDRAVEHGLAMVEEGADLLDVGGESTRPGSDPVDTVEEQARILPVVERLTAETDVPVSVDTRHGATARAAIAAGARILNDVSGLADDEAARVAAETGVPVVLMHMRGTPADMRRKTEHLAYDDVVRDVIRELGDRLERAERAGVGRDRILIDPGIGFAKDAEQSLTLIRRLPELRELKRPVLVGPSRKSFLGAVVPTDPEDRLYLTLGALAACVHGGAHVLRVHDVLPAVHLVRAYEALT